MTIGIPTGYTALPVWTFRPDWTDPLVDTFEWLTQISQGDGGDEQRFGRRLTPRRSFDFSVNYNSQERAIFDLAMNYASGFDWWVPKWHEGVTVRNLTVGQTVFSFNTTLREFFNSELVLVLGQNSEQAEVVAITSTGVSSGGITCSPGLYNAYPVARIYPLQQGHLVTKPQLSRLTSNVYTGTASFTLKLSQAEVAVSGDSTAFESYNGYVIMDFEPDDNQTNAYDYDRLEPVIDGMTGLRDYFDFSFFGANSRTISIVLVGRLQHRRILDLLYVMKGSLIPVWVPTFSRDMVLYSNAASGTYYLYVNKLNLENWGGITNDRIRIFVKMRTGGYQVGDITFYDPSNPAYDVLTMFAPWSITITLANIAFISFMQLCRLDGESIAINRMTDPDGVSTVSMIFRNLKVQPLVA